MALVVVVSNPLVWKRVRAALTIRSRIACLFCARLPGLRALPIFAWVFVAIIREYAHEIYECTHECVKRQDKQLLHRTSKEVRFTPRWLQRASSYELAISGGKPPFLT